MGALIRQNSDVAKKLAPAEFDVLTRAIQIIMGKFNTSVRRKVDLIKDQIGENRPRE